MTVNEFCEKIGISRQKFYRFAKEPRRFTKENLYAIENVLQLSEKDAMLLRTYLSPSIAVPVNADRSRYIALITALFRQRPSEDLSVNMYNIEYNDTSGSATMHSPDTIARIMAGPCRRTDAPLTGGVPENADARICHEYAFTIYNCAPSPEGASSMSSFAARKSMITIARITNVLERILFPANRYRLYMRHYLSESRRKLVLNEDLNDRDAVLYNLQFLNCILPLLSSVPDYSIDTSANMRQYWTSHSNFCLVEHKCTPAGPEEDPFQSREPEMSGDTCTEYYILLFSDTGECSVCRLGNEEAFHIFRFLSIDTRDKSFLSSIQHAPVDPNQYYYELDQKVKNILIHPDLCFDDIPREMWTVLYEEVKTSSNRDYFEAVFRSLIDPYDQYAFLDFDNIVNAAITTLEKRHMMNDRLGRIILCHPEGLSALARTGIIQDLVSDEVDYTGMQRNGTPLRFPAPMIRHLLELIRSNIQSRIDSPGQAPDKSGSENYYILHPNFPYPECSSVIYKDYGYTAIYNKGIDRHKITGIFRNCAIGTVLYDYVTNKMLRDRGKDLDSGVLSDEHAVALLDKLINEVGEVLT